MFYLRRLFQTLVPAHFPKRPSKILLTLICLTLSVQSAAGQSSMGKSSLSHLDGVSVNVVITEEAQEQGLDTDRIKSDVEIELRKADIRVYTRQEFMSSETRPSLLITVKTYKRGTGVFSYNVSTDVAQVVFTVGGSQASGVTYQVFDTIGTVGEKNLRDVAEVIQDDVRVFINDWLSVHE